jgi:hypothetical protein
MNPNRNEAATQLFMTKSLATQSTFDNAKALADALIKGAKNALAKGDRETALILKHLAEAAIAKAKAEEDQHAPGHLDASEKAAITETSKRKWNATKSADGRPQRMQRNLKPAGEGIDEILDKADVREGDVARCARYCKSASGTDVQGRGCAVCKGAGFHAGERIRKARAAGTSVHAAHDKSAV